MTLAKQLGAIVFTYKGEDVVRTILQFAREYRVGHMVTGSPRKRSFWEKIRGKRGIVDRLIHEAEGITVTILDTREKEESPGRVSGERACRKGGPPANTGRDCSYEGWRKRGK